MNNDSKLPDAACGNLRLQRWLLRIAAVMAVLTLPAVLWPRQAIEKLSWVTGLGHAPQSALLVYFGGGGTGTSHMRRDIGLAWLALPLSPPKP